MPSSKLSVSTKYLLCDFDAITLSFHTFNAPSLKSPLLAVATSKPQNHKEISVRLAHGQDINIYKFCHEKQTSRRLPHTQKIRKFVPSLLLIPSGDQFINNLHECVKDNRPDIQGWRNIIITADFGVGTVKNEKVERKQYMVVMFTQQEE